MWATNIILRDDSSLEIHTQTSTPLSNLNLYQYNTSILQTHSQIFPLQTSPHTSPLKAYRPWSGVARWRSWRSCRRARWCSRNLINSTLYFRFEGGYIEEMGGLRVQTCSLGLIVPCLCRLRWRGSRRLAPGCSIACRSRGNLRRRYGSQRWCKGWLGRRSNAFS